MVLLRPCKTTAAYEAIPERDRRLDLERLERDMAATGWSLVANARVMLIVKRDLEVTVFQSGKVLIKTRDRPQAEATWSQVEPLLEAVSRDGS
jgi:hypothetical protein